jgi:ribonuclease VapC
VEAVTLEHARVAREAWRRFGKGHHAAALNLGDCLSYALAKTSGEPLLFKGTDFSQTDALAVAY